MTIILDIDGTLVNSTDRHYLLLEEILHQHGIKINLDKNHYLNYKRSGENNFNYMQDKLNLDRNVALQISKEWIKYIEHEKWIKYDLLYEDTIYFLENIKRMNAKIYYLSSRHNKKNLIRELERLNLKKYADTIYIVDVKNPTEAKRKIIDKIKERNDCNDVYMIGDTEVDYYSAKESHIKYFILNRGFRSKTYFDKLRIKTYNSLLDVLGGLSNEECGNC